MEKLFGHQREGFIWQKLREPRSYDYQEDAEQGLQRAAADAAVHGARRRPARSDHHVRAGAGRRAARRRSTSIKPTPRRKAIVAGQRSHREVQLHRLPHARAWIAGSWPTRPTTSPSRAEIADYPFLQAALHAAADQGLAGRSTRAACGTPRVTGMPVVGRRRQADCASTRTALPIEAGRHRRPRPFYFVHAVGKRADQRPGLAGRLAEAAGARNRAIEKRYPPHGRLPGPAGLSGRGGRGEEDQSERQARRSLGLVAAAAGGRRPQGADRVAAQLPARSVPDSSGVVLRMPKFNMSPAEATQAGQLLRRRRSASTIPTTSIRAPASRTWPQQNAEHPNRLGDALKIVTDNNYCIKCHLVGDFTPTGSERAKAPQLGRGLQAAAARFHAADWIANPKRMLPYTGMPVNIPHDKPVSQSLLQGRQRAAAQRAWSILLLNYDRFMESKTSIKPMIKVPRARGGSRAEPAPATATTTRPSKRRSNDGQSATCFIASCLAMRLLLSAALLPAAGCGKPRASPPGAPQDADAPTVDLGTESGPRTPAAGSNASTSGERIAAGRARRQEVACSVHQDSARPDDCVVRRPRRPGRRMGHAHGPLRVRRQGPDARARSTPRKTRLCKVKLTDEDLLVDAKGGLANAVIMLKTKDVAVHPGYESSAKDKVVLDNKNCRFEPHVLVVRTSQTLLLKNSDPTGHNTQRRSRSSNDGINPILAAGGDPLKHKFAKPKKSVPVKVGCNIHPWMGAWLIVRDGSVRGRVRQGRQVHDQGSAGRQGTGVRPVAREGRLPEERHVQGRQDRRQGHVSRSRSSRATTTWATSRSAARSSR